MQFDLAEIVAFHQQAAKQHLLQAGACDPVLWLYTRDHQVKAFVMDMPDEPDRRMKMYHCLQLVAVAEDAVAFVHCSEMWMAPPSWAGRVCDCPERTEALCVVAAARADDGSTIRQVHHAAISRTKHGRVRGIGAWQMMSKCESPMLDLLPPADLPDEYRASVRAHVQQYLTEMDGHTIH